MTDAVSTLQQWAKDNQLGQATLNPEGTSLTLGDVTLQATEKCSVTLGDKTCEYVLASLFLQILDPQQSLLKYRQACKKHSVKDIVKASDKATVVGYFLETTDDAAVAPAEEVAAEAVVAQAAPPVEEPEVEQPPKDDDAAAAAAPPSPPKEKKHHDKKHHDKHRSKDKDKHHHDKHDRHEKHRKDKHTKKRPSSGASSSTEKPSKPKLRKTIDNEKLFTNLVTVVDKRRSTKDTEQNAQLVEALNPEGFRVTAELLATFREKTQTIINNEIPVGNSASILKAAAGKDLSRILKLYMETLQPPKSSKSGSAKDSSITSSGQKKSFRPYLVGKKPIIIVPKGMTAILTLINAHEFFSNSAYVPREVMTKQKAKSGQMTIKTTFQRRVGQRLGGGMVEYELMDNPKSKLPTSKDWDRVVAVVALGHSWQFKDWPGYYSNPVKLFNSTFGFYVGMEGAKLPPDLQGWSVVHGKLNRDKRGMDSVTHASFWNGLDEFMAIHKPEMLPQPET